MWKRRRIPSTREMQRVTQITGVLRGQAELPCDLGSSSQDDQVTLVLWYKNDSGTPIYSSDFRNSDQAPDKVKHSPSDVLGNRAFFRIRDNDAVLQLEPVKEQDEGVYRCRVDFRKSRTRNQQVNLTVIVPPEKVFIVDEAGQEIQESLWNVNEGSKVILSCEAEGGRPTPRVKWWRGSKLLEESWEASTTGKVRSDLILAKLTRGDLFTNLTCQASNTNLTVPVSKTLTLDLNLNPLDVRITGEREPLSAGKHYELQCKTTGSRPKPIITWLKNSKRLKYAKEVTTPSSNGSNTTIYSINFIPVAEDNGKFLTCRVENPRISGSVREDSWHLDVHYVPIAQLELGSSLRMENLKEGDDVYFECTIRANPRTYRVDWKFEGQYLDHNISAGIIISNQSLVLQKVRRTSAGAYACIAKNVEGDGESNKVVLKIKHPPSCRPNQKTVYGIAKHETAKIACEVNANPPMVSFKWAFNNSDEYLDVAQKTYTQGGLRSTVSYTPRSESDYGVLHCWGRNDIGSQKEPCKFIVIAAGPPEVLHNCTIVNQTEESLHVECVEGFDGGMSQHFIMEVYDAITHELIVNISSPNPVFEVNDLQPGTGFMISIYSANGKGRSESLALTGSTLRIAERRTGITPNILPITPILGVLIGVVAALVLVAVVIVFIMKLRAADDEEKKPESDVDSLEKQPMTTLPRSHSGTPSPSKKEVMENNYENSDEKNPDVVPSDDSVYADVDEKFTPVSNNVVGGGGGAVESNNINRIYENVNRGLTKSPPPNMPNSRSNENTYENVKNMRNHAPVVKPPIRPKPARPEDLTYAELQHPNNVHYGSPGSTQPKVIRGSEPTIYAQIDHSRKAPSPSQTSPRSPNSQTLERCLRSPSLKSPTLATIDPDEYADILTVETPLINHTQQRESTV